MTTIRVAERAGVSIGTLYQYFPQKQALLFAALERHLERVVKAIEDAAASAHHRSLSSMVEAIVAAFVAAKIERLDESRALYAVALEFDVRDYVQDVEARIRRALEIMLLTASDADFDDIETISLMLMGALVGPTRMVLEAASPHALAGELRTQLQSLCLGYLERQARRKGAGDRPPGQGCHRPVSEPASVANRFRNS
ncbi:TetR/AcrR family transcriptional regulator [Cupriavidus sp. AU9028]|uniref:TetR/AcrR family transcriptional regulator n=1 Tax=Cupriavidus sp. AU9028 TaxID=2871157 RepID=UPI0021057516|nr:TetR/AcrR family transcriptional regulator [Cupriavidus sp. AU9028]